VEEKQKKNRGGGTLHYKTSGQTAGVTWKPGRKAGRGATDLCTGKIRPAQYLQREGKKQRETRKGRETVETLVEKSKSNSLLRGGDLKK